MGAPLDPVTSTRVRAVLHEARRNGRDEIESLAAAGLLVTPGVTRHIQLLILQELLRDLESWRPAEYLRRVNKTQAPTPKDMYDGILGYVADYVEREVEK